jgi:hypothetical protein
MKLKKLLANGGHDKRGRKIAERRIDRLCETVESQGEDLARLQRQVSTIFDEIQKIKALKR